VKNELLIADCRLLIEFVIVRQSAISNQQSKISEYTHG